MREISASSVTDKVREMCIEANIILPKDISNRIHECYKNEPWAPAKDTLGKLIENMDIARDASLPICQDTGMAWIYIEIGQEVHITGGDLCEAIHEGVRRGYADGFLRKSVVADPLRRKNTGDNTPAVITTDIVPGDKLTVTVGPKGFGSENMSRLVMFPPAKGEKGVKDFVVETAQIAGPNPCPPIVIGVGIGGTFDRVALLAKKALMRSTDARNPDKYYSDMEAELLERVNAIGVGPQGFGGKTTALAVNIETYPTHIAGLPVAVNINCHVTRHIKATL
ncbi:fumarate hydratase [Synergistales bacterium]|nr:fumarate hydratase [Synergistales bacterium]GHV54911.1 fumarate hydratase [Synergistales bacterium]